MRRSNSSKCFVRKNILKYVLVFEDRFLLCYIVINFFFKFSKLNFNLDY